MTASLSKLAQAFRPEDESLDPRTKAQVQVYRLLSLLGAVLFPVVGLLFEASSFEAVDPIGPRLVIAGLLAGLVGASYFSARIRHHYVELAWGLLYLTMAWVTALTALNQFSGEHAVVFLFTYALFGGIIALGSESLEPVLWFLSAGFLFVGIGFWGTPLLRTSPLILTGTMALVALFESICAWWGLSMRDRLARQKRKFRRQKHLLEQTQRLTGAWMADLRTEEVSWSQEGHRIHELDPDAELSLEKAFEFPHPEAYERVHRAFERCVEEGEPYDLEHPIVTAEGNRRWVRTVGEPVEEENGEIVRVAGAFQDFTERKRAERALKRERERLRRHRDLLRRTQEVAKVGGWEYDPSTDTIKGTDQLSRILGLSEGQDFDLERGFQFYPPDERDTVREKVTRCMEHGDPIDLEVPLVREDGQRRWVRVRGQRQQREGGAVRLTGTLQDITEQKEVEQVLRDEQEVLREMYHITADRDTAFDAKVRALIDLGRSHLGLSYGYLTRISEGTQELTHARGAPPTLRPGERFPLSTSYCRKTVEEGLLAIQNAPEEGWRGDPVGETFGVDAYIGSRVEVGEDLYGTFCFAAEAPRKEPFSEREQTFVELLTLWAGYEIDRRRATQRLEKQNQRLDRFASVVSHDLRNPLNVATGRLELAEEALVGPDPDPQAAERSSGDDADPPSSDAGAPQAAEHIDAARRALGRMNEIIEDMLTLTWSRREGDPDEIVPVTLEEVAKRCWPEVEGRDTSLTVETDADIVAHEGRLQQLLENLFRNAIEHGGEGVAVTVGLLSAEASEGEGAAEGFFVEDDGPGIPEEDREKVLETGYTTSEDGTGLGLSIAWSVTDAHGWDLSITDGREGGARFEIKGARVQR